MSYGQHDGLERGLGGGSHGEGLEVGYEVEVVGSEEEVGGLQHGVAEMDLRE